MKTAKQIQRRVGYIVKPYEKQYVLRSQSSISSPDVKCLMIKPNKDMCHSII